MFLNGNAYALLSFFNQISQIHVKLYDENYMPMVPQQQWNATLDLMFFEVYEKSGIQNPRNYMLEHRFGEK